MLERVLLTFTLFFNLIGFYCALHYKHNLPALNNWMYFCFFMSSVALFWALKPNVTKNSYNVIQKKEVENIQNHNLHHSEELNLKAQSEIIYNQFFKGIKKNDFLEGFFRSFCHYLEACKGILYESVENSNQIVFKNGFALTENEDLTKLKFEKGEGMVGAAILGNELTLLSKIPEEYILPISGLGSGKPASILFIPVFMDGNLKGLMEIATFKSLSKNDVELCKLVLEKVLK